MSETKKQEYPVMVSVLCTVYNHEKYLRKSLDGFVMQKTAFPFEVIINDDASTDGSATILREYEEKYPELFHIIYQTENQYSKKVGITATYLYPAARGKYIAFCEGDDYWTDPLKLQKQVDALEANPLCHMSMHRVCCCAENGDAIEKNYPSFSLDTGIISGEKFLHMFAKSHFVHTCSYVFDASFIKKFYPPLDPDHQVIPSPFGDASCAMFHACIGDLYYIDDSMSCHRMNSENGWTERFNRSSIDKKVAQKEQAIDMTRRFDSFSNYRYHDAFAERIFDRQCLIADITGDYRPLLQGENKTILRKNRSLRFQIRVYLSVLFPNTVPKLIKKYYQKKGIKIGEI